MKINKLSIALLLTPLFVAGCSNDKKKYFEEERYEKMLYIVSDDKNIHELIYDLDGADNNIRNISIACSGTNPTTEAAELSLMEDDILFDQYNYTNFVEDESRFAIKMNENDYEVETENITYPVGAQHTLVPIKIEMSVIESLDPDKTYFIPVAIKESTPYSIVKMKGNALMRIQRKNKYTNTAIPVNYSISGYEGAGYFLITKTMVPLTKNQVRINIGARRLPAEPEKHPDFILKNTVIIEIAEDNSLTVKPYDPNSLEVETLSNTELHPGDGAYALYNNQLDPETTSFYLYYKFKLKSGGNWVEVREAIRLPIIDLEIDK